TWVQIVKAVFLMAGAGIVTLLVLAKYGFNLSALLGDAAAQSGKGDAFLNPGLKYGTDDQGIWGKIDLISLGLALVLGTAGLPHILIRFYTVPSAREARISVVWAMFIIGAFYIMTTFLGFGAALLVGQEKITAADKAGNMAAPLLAEALGGNLFLAFISAVAFATILAVVAGLVISAAGAFAHDFYSNVLRGGKATEAEQMRVAKIASVGVGVVSIILALIAKDMNVAFLVALAFAVASSANLPVILFTLFWKRFNTSGAVWGILSGLISSVVLVLISPNFMGDSAIFPLNNPAILSVPIGFLGACLGTLLSKEPESEQKFPELYVRSNTGIGAE
ncbi:MAG: cation acetate symporter, partial [Planifilum fulgidum]